MAALTRSGARKASEIVMLTFRTLQPSRSAIASAFDDGSVDELIEPMPPFANRSDKQRAVLGPDRTGSG